MVFPPVDAVEFTLNIQLRQENDEDTNIQLMFKPKKTVCKEIYYILKSASSKDK